MFTYSGRPGDFATAAPCVRTARPSAGQRRGPLPTCAEAATPYRDHAKTKASPRCVRPQGIPSHAGLMPQYVTRPSLLRDPLAASGSGLPVIGDGNA